MANQIPPVQSNQQLVDPQTGFGRPPFILLINNLINQIVNNATGLISKFFATKPSGTTPITTSGTYGSGVTISLDDSRVSPGTYGDATHVPQITVDGHGLLTNVVPIAITGGGGGAPVGESAWKVDATGTGSPQNITIPDNNPALQAVLVTVNGVRYPTSQYTISGTTLTLTTNASGDDIEIVGPIGDGISSPFLVDATGTGSPQNITLPIAGMTLQSVLVYVNGIRQGTSLYSIVGSTLTLTTNTTGDSIEIVGPIGTAFISQWDFLPPTTTEFTNPFGTIALSNYADNPNVGLCLSLAASHTGAVGMAKPIPAGTSFTATMKMAAGFINNGTANYFMALGESTLNHFLVMGYDSRLAIHLMLYGTAGYDGFEDLTTANPFDWYRMSYDHTTGIVSAFISNDGIQWVPYTTYNYVSHFGADPAYIGLGISTESYGFLGTMSISYWKDTL